ncbi:hypothetical protein [Nocardioides sp. CFH 31398]|uniref:hypothetical protein n=1 Tax=Nocardioides sp. CFH 31398 TaxID=2919579 RepID=UPI001F06AEF1|nr:hypothetical protein [Nocardioides sp. CFH 31398]
MWLARRWANEALAAASDARRRGRTGRGHASSVRALAADDAAFLARTALLRHRCDEARVLARRAREEALAVRRLCA